MNPRLAALRERLQAGLELLPDKPEESVESTWRTLCHMADGRPLSAVAAMRAPPPVPLAGRSVDVLEALVERRLAGEPLAHIVGRQHFMGLEMLSGPGALIPRAETELLARAAIELLETPPPRHPPNVIDVCTGSGNLALAIAARVPDAVVAAADVSAEAIALARRNARHLGLEERIRFCIGDLLQPLEGTRFHGHADLVVCNPPYIPTRTMHAMAGEIARHEPVRAFDGGPFGVAIVMRLLDAVPAFLRAGGWLAFEVGAGQAPAVLRRVERACAAQFDATRTLADAEGTGRVIMARRRRT